MGGLWTPSGNDGAPSEGADRPDAGAAPGPGAPQPTPEQRAAAEAELRRVQEELAGTPVAEIVANHAIGLWQLAVLHLGRQDRDLDETQLAIDALAALVDGLGERLDPNAEALREALAQVRLAYVQVSAPDSDEAAPEGA